MIFSLKTKNPTMASGKMMNDSMGRLLLETIQQRLAQSCPVVMSAAIDCDYAGAIPTTRIARVPPGHADGQRRHTETDINLY
jgi:hypothetical protein